MSLLDKARGDSCYIIAEIGHNHQGDPTTAKRMVDLAAECGVSAVKVQIRSLPTLFTKAFYDQPYNSENAYGPTYGKHREALELGFKTLRWLKAYAESLGLDFFATAFDEASVGSCVDLDLPAIKIASGDIDNWPLLVSAGRTGLPIILSTGGATMDAIERAMDAVDHLDVALLQCTASYPCAYEELDLKVIQTLKKWAPDLVVGASLHDNGIAMAPVAYALGARVIEKHITLDRTMKGTDHPFSLEPQGLAKMVRDIRRAEVAMGDGIKKVYPSEAEPLRKMGKSIYVARDLPAGHILGDDDLMVRSPAEGLSPMRWMEVLGKRLNRSLAQEEPLRASDIAIEASA